MVEKRLLALVACVLLSVAASAHAWPPLTPAVINGGAAIGVATGPVLWSAWNEGSDLTLHTDQNSDGADDTNICFYKSGAALDETSRGVLMPGSAGLAFVQTGGVPAASGTPPSRALNGTDQGFAIFDNTLPDTTFAGASQWLVLVCLDTVSGASGGDYFFRYRDVSGANWLEATVVSNAVQFFVRRNSAVKINNESTSVFNTTGKLYVVLACDGAKMLYGWGATRPTKASDLTFYATISTTCTWDAALSSIGFTMSFFYNSTLPGVYLPGNARYSIISNYCFIDLDT